ncbi:hypothetical protein [Aliiroseovarius crassostreae]|uniref:hypothetical protein n=1 Tax=Aliiroseovarius crassostreae TaxID=154981 RepID=UPI00111412BA|nr:hypothetical protein [Aliiroseovarius crassostreae]
MKLNFLGELGKLLILEESECTTDNFIQLVCASNIVLEGFPDKGTSATCGFPLDDDPDEREKQFENVFRSVGFFERFIWRETLPSAVALAAHAWGEKKLIYAIHKLAHSYETESVTPHSMHPRYGQAFEKHTDEFASHVRSSIAINLAYSAIEELGLTVQASSKKRRFLPGANNEWNPKVLEPFVGRLSKSNIERDATIEWVTRGAATELQVFSEIGEASEFSDGEKIRDSMVSLPYAIQFCEYLRNQLTAHSFKEGTECLGPYEVYNCQNVARFLLLKRCEMFNVRTKDLKNRF